MLRYKRAWQQPLARLARLAAGGDGNLYFSLTHQLGVITQRSGQHLYEIPTLDTKVQELITGQDGNLWFSEVPDTSGNCSIIGKLVV
ncbi:MAG TPA: hypothetical protein VFU63_00300 [Ktedonobacterales bacterium]|nr:hypothetical protein [Ktedonobacterales bacterium]